jgi:hypothetical protein
MLEAHIVSPRGSLSYAGDAHPYDLEMLWNHVHEARCEVDADDVRLEIVVHDEGVDSCVTAWIRRLAATGVQVQMLFARMPSPPNDEDDARIAI